MKVTYINYYNEIGDLLDKTKRLEEDINIGYMIQRSYDEGYKNYEVTEILKEKQEDVTLQSGNTVKRVIVSVRVKEHPYIKTHCKHDWHMSTNIQLTSPISHHRQCKKCDLKEKYNLMTCKWIAEENINSFNVVA